MWFLIFLFEIEKQTALVILGGEFLPLMQDGELWRSVTSAFLHNGIFHLAINMWALLSIGKIIEQYYGPKVLLITYVLTAITGSLFSITAIYIGIYLSGGLPSGFPVSVGASGAIFGLIGLMIGNKISDRGQGISIDSYINTNTLILFVFYNFLLGFGLNILGTSTSINNWAHLGGLVGGIILGFMFKPINNYLHSGSQNVLIKVLFIVTILILLISYLGLILSIFY